MIHEGRKNSPNGWEIHHRPGIAIDRKRNAEAGAGFASYALEAGDREAARGYAKLLRELDPEDPRYARLAAQVEAAGGR